VPTLRVVTVGPGKDYSSLSAAEAGEQGDLVALDRQLDIECYAFQDTSQVIIDGWTTDATRYIRIYAKAGERHAGVWNTSKYYLELSVSNSSGGVLRIRDEYTRLEYLQVRNTNGSPTQFNSTIYDDDGGNVTVDGCITRGGHAGIDLATNGTKVNTARNCIAYGGVRGGIGLNTAGNRVDWLNCTLIGTSYGLQNQASGTYALAKNVYAHGGTAGFVSTGSDTDGGVFTKTNCMSSDTSATNNTNGGGATNCTNNVAHSTVNFVSVTSGSEDYHLVSGSALIDAGTDLSGTFTKDIDGDTRSGTWDVGADEFVAIIPASSAGITIIRHQRRLILDPRCPVNWKHPLNRGRVGWWMVPPNPGWRGGLTFRDLVRGGRKPNDGTLVNGPVWRGTKRPGGWGALEFTGTSGQDVSTANDFLVGMTAYSWACWVRADGAPDATERAVWTVDGNDTTLAFYWGHPSSAFRFAALQRDSAGNYFTVAYGSGTADRWYHVAGTWDGTNLRLYVDGLAVSSPTAVTSLRSLTTAKSLQMGNAATNVPFDGQIDDLSIWRDRALTASAIQALHQQSRQGYPDLLNWLPARTWSFPSQPVTTSTGAGSIVLKTTRKAIDVKCPVNWKHPLNRSRVAWWMVPPNPGWRGGLTFRDLVRGGRKPNDGTLTNMTPSAWKGPQGRLGGWGALEFSAASSQHVATTLTDLAPVAGAISFGLYPTLPFNDGTVHGIAGPAAFVDTPSFQKFSDNNLYMGWSGGRVIVAASSSNYTQNTWQHYCFTWVSGGTHTLYRNGIVLGTATGATVSNAGVAWHFGRCFATSSFFTGRMDDVSFFYRALSAAEILALYQQSRRGYPDLLNWLPARTVFSSEQAAAGGGFQPAWARRGTMVGGGVL
jgi:hypothetical protein